MKIDRAVFLSLTAALAASVACEEAAVPPRAPEPPTAPVVTADIAPPTAIARPVDTAAPIAPEPAVAAAPPAPPTEGIAAEAACYGSSRAFNPAKTGCNDDLRASISCAFTPAPHVEGGVDASDLTAYCNVVTAKLKPKLASAAAVCMHKNAARWMKGQGDAYCEAMRCGTEALFAACDDAAAFAPCNAIASSCAGVDRGTCRAWLSGMNARARDHAARCLKRRCSDGFGECFASMEGF